MTILITKSSKIDKNLANRGNLKTLLHGFAVTWFCCYMDYAIYLKISKPSKYVKDIKSTKLTKSCLNCKNTAYILDNLDKYTKKDQNYKIKT